MSSPADGNTPFTRSPSLSPTHTHVDAEDGERSTTDREVEDEIAPLEEPQSTAAALLNRPKTCISIQSDKPSNALSRPPRSNPEPDIDTNAGGNAEIPFRPPPPLKRSDTSGSSKPYSAFSTSTKWLIVILGGIAAIFSPISSNIFVPAIPALSIDFNESSEKISLAVTIYLVFQAITPSFFGSMSDSFGRRPVYIGTLVAYMGANVGLACMPTSAYWLLLFLRALQATGGSAVISIGAGAVADVAEPRERGTFMSIFQCGALIGPAFGPLLGGVFASTLGWRAIFWFLTISTGVVLVPLILFFPETLRALVGDGSIPPPALNTSPIILLKRRRMEKEADGRKEKVERPPRRPYQPLSAFLILFTPEIVILFVFVSLMYLEFYCILTVYSTALSDTYHLTELQIGLCYLPSGIGSIISSIVNGRQVDYYYRREADRVGGDYRKKPNEFRLELTRIRCILPFMSFFIVATIALGWCLQVKAPLAATLVMNFFVGLGTGTINTATVYGQDIKVGQGGAVSASLNLVRCIFGAIGTAVIQVMYSSIGAGWTFVILSGICVLGLPLPWAVIAYAPRWRAARAEKEERKRVEREKKMREKETEGNGSAVKREDGSV